MKSSFLSLPIPAAPIERADFADFAVDDWSLVAMSITLKGAVLSTLEGWLCEGRRPQAGAYVDFEEHCQLHFADEPHPGRVLFRRAAMKRMDPASFQTASREDAVNAESLFINEIIRRSVAHFGPFVTDLAMLLNRPD